MLSLIYRLLSRIGFAFYKSNVFSNICFSSKKAKKTLKIGRNVRIYNPNVTIGENVQLYDGVIIWGDGPIKIGNNVRIGFNTIIHSTKNAGIFIGCHSAISANCYIIDSNHTSNIIKTLSSDADISERIEIGENVLIYSHCVIAKGVRLGNYSVVAANSFVNRSVDENAIVAGSPAKVIKFRN